jgi:hypothetical protein
VGAAKVGQKLLFDANRIANKVEESKVKEGRKRLRETEGVCETERLVGTTGRH